MSGITPILDTLLHQVLGKRVDVPVARQTPEPVRPLSPAEAPPAVRSDSRLDPRSAPLPDLPATGQRGRAPQTLTLPVDTAPGSTQTHFSAAARTIADILARYPAPPSAVRPTLPLMTAADTEAPTLANRLQASFSQSGLFYESHLQGWYRGEVSGARLAQEPQMRFTRPADPAAAPAPVEGRPVAEGEEIARTAPRPLSDDANQTLQGILRHQLEALATPVLRWEGDVWSGIFMALMIQVPTEAPRQPHADQDQDGDEPGEEGAWRSDLTLELAALGPVRVRLDVRGDDLSIDLATRSEQIAERMRADSQRLRAGLQGCGFARIQLRVAADERP
ncbi:MAG TPA: flagellar hook-length control protein FliK [Alcanivorax sp.]|nr:flagellar hook-length control protein FliK [Alcanivorax sp.]